MDAATKAELEQLYQTWTIAWLEKDAEVVDAIMDDDYVYVGPDGRIYDRATILGIIRSPDYGLEWGHRTGVVVHPLGPDTAAIVSRWRGQGSYEGRVFLDDHRCTSVFVRRGSAWMMALEHCSAIAAGSDGTS